eukprot:TRINITY_DN2801_c0_g1_i1.p1 TRINITY_DN2801_c0_g1~~TRINITY_DN2801_c0_g1_i1.p1  ORF type:complete len:551 (+),score=232.60 TRINITY_DN2801_c0_g1_i1:151-1803(+)
MEQKIFEELRSLCDRFKIPKITKEELQFQGSLGSGSYGTVWKVTVRGQICALKELTPKTGQAPNWASFVSELSMLCQLSHPHIVKSLGVIIDHQRSFGYIMEFVETSVDNLLYGNQNSNNRGSHHLRMRIGLETSRGMQWLHQLNPVVLHRDIKPANILLDRNYHVKICDFGFAQVRETAYIQEKTTKGTPVYTSLEVLESRQFTEKADVYSFSLLLWELYTCSQPFSNINTVQELKSSIANNIRPPVNSIVLAELKQLLELCWSNNERERLPFSTITQALEVITIKACLPPVAASFWREQFNSNYEIHSEIFNEKLIEYFTNKSILSYIDIENVQLPLTVETISNISTSQLNYLRISNVLTTEQFQQILQTRYPHWDLQDIENGHKIESITMYLRAVIGKINPIDNQIWINIEEFGRLCDTIGDFNVVGIDFTFGRLLAGLASYMWFFGNYSQADAERTLSQLAPNNFLLRFSSVRGALTISYSDTQHVLHERITIQNPGFLFRNIIYHTIPELISAHRNIFVTPCPGSPIFNLLSFKKRGGYITVKKN